MTVSKYVINGAVSQDGTVKYTVPVISLEIVPFVSGDPQWCLKRAIEVLDSVLAIFNKDYKSSYHAPVVSGTIKAVDSNSVETLVYTYNGNYPI